MADAEFTIYARARSGVELGPLTVIKAELRDLRFGFAAVNGMGITLHRTGGLPAVVGKNDETREWWVNGDRHRIHGKPAVIRAHGVRKWWVHGFRHRAGDLPAVIAADGSLEWWVNDEVHRDGSLPAILSANGVHEWWVRDVNTGDHQATDFRDGSLRHVFVTAVCCLC